MYPSEITQVCSRATQLEGDKLQQRQFAGMHSSLSSYYMSTQRPQIVAPNLVTTLDDDTLNIIFRYLSFDPDLLTVSHVSKQWRDVAHAHPTFWQKIYVHRLDACGVFWLELRLQAAPGAMIELRIKSPALALEERTNLTEHEQKGAHLIASNISRLCALYIDGAEYPSTNALIYSILQRVAENNPPLPLLERLELRSRGESNEWPKLRGSLFKARNLKHLTLQHVVLEEYDMFSQLRSLMIEHSQTAMSMSLPDIMSGFPFLMDLRYRCIPLQHDGTAGVWKQAIRQGARRLTKLDVPWRLLDELINETAIQGIPWLLIYRPPMEHILYAFPGSLTDSTSLLVDFGPKKVVTIRDAATGVARSTDVLHLLGSHPLWDALFRRTSTFIVAARYWEYWIPFPGPPAVDGYPNLRVIVLRLSPGVTSDIPVKNVRYKNWNRMFPAVRILRLENQLLEYGTSYDGWIDSEISRDAVQTFIKAAFSRVTWSLDDIELQMGPGVRLVG
ncbi:hypothetical protein BKA62DRAFT_352800 [Auriculariales sp. MPI-PUGE-AT-0066]|nr:hypothetical protein BKA62DRAFT_352800 [Auriculariales sp. MPI-PUGE-AT-0066]